MEHCAWAGTVFGLVSIVGLTPLLAWAVRDLPLHPAAFSSGLAILCVVPPSGIAVSLVSSAAVRSVPLSPPF